MLLISRITAVSLAIYIFISCGEFNRQYPCLVEGNDCEETENYPEQDPNSTSGGQTGGRGPQGAPGPAGPPGSDGAQGSPGSQGAPGEVGPAGPAGTDGQGCVVTAAVNGALITCGSGSVLVLNGTDGQDGEQGPAGQDGDDAPPTAYSIVEILDPCGDAPGLDQVILRTANDTLITTVRYSGNRDYLTVLTPGNYVTTEGDSCSYMVHGDMSVTW